MVLTGQEEVQTVPVALGHNLYSFTFLWIYRAGSVRKDDYSNKLREAQKKKKKNRARMVTCMLPTGSFLFLARASCFALIVHSPTMYV